MKPQKLKKVVNKPMADHKDVIIDNQKTQILGLRKALQRAEAKLIAAGF